MQTYFGEPIRMGTNYCYIPWLWVPVVMGNVLLHYQLRYVVVAVGRRCEILSGMVTVDCMLHLPVNRGHS